MVETRDIYIMRDAQVVKNVIARLALSEEQQRRYADTVAAERQMLRDALQKVRSELEQAQHLVTRENMLRTLPKLSPTQKTELEVVQADRSRCYSAARDAATHALNKLGMITT